MRLNRFFSVTHRGKKAEDRQAEAAQEPGLQSYKGANPAVAADAGLR